MRKDLKIRLAILLGLLISQVSWAQSPSPEKNSSTVATDITNADIQAALEKNPSAPINDQAVRVVSINGEYNVGVGIVRRTRTTGQVSGGAVEHNDITEVYHVITGTGTLVTGGTLEHPKSADPNSAMVKNAVGPSSLGERIEAGTSRQIGPGDIVIIPPNTPHWFSAVTSDEIVYLVVRVDPKKVLPAGKTSP